MGGRTIINGMKARMLKNPTRANNSDTRDKGLLQWLLVTRKIAAARGAVLVIMNTKEKMPM